MNPLGHSVGFRERISWYGLKDDSTIQMKGTNIPAAIASMTSVRTIRSNDTFPLPNVLGEMPFSNIDVGSSFLQFPAFRFRYPIRQLSLGVTIAGRDNLLAT